MNEEERLIALERALAMVQRHLEQQDLEMYRMSQRMEELQQQLELQKQFLRGLTENQEPAPPHDTRPPHY